MFVPYLIEGPGASEFVRTTDRPKWRGLGEADISQRGGFSASIVNGCCCNIAVSAGLKFYKAERKGKRRKRWLRRIYHRYSYLRRKKEMKAVASGEAFV
jgi:hypothetical protein